MEDYIAQVRRDREVCQDFLTANPTQHSCTVLRRPIVSEPTFKPGDTVTVYIYERAVYETAYVLSEDDFDESGDLDHGAIEDSVIDIVDWGTCEVQDRSIQVYPA